jgi:hypothetical protein
MTTPFVPIARSPRGTASNRPIPTGLKNPFIVTADEEKSPVARAMARMMLEGTRRTDPFGSSDLTEEQGRQLARALIGRKMANIGGEFVAQGAGGAADALLNTAQGAAALGDMVLPGNLGMGKTVGRVREFVGNQVVGQPETAAGAVGRGLGYMGGTVASYMIPSAAVAKGASALGAETAIGRAFGALANPLGQRGLTATGAMTAPARIASGAALNAPTNIALGMSPENSAQAFAKIGREAEGQPGVLPELLRTLGATAEPFAKSALGRVAYENLMDLGPNALLEGMSAGVRKVLKPARQETPSEIGDAWTARQLALGQRGVPQVRKALASYGEVGSAMPRATAVDDQFKQRVADWYENAVSDPDNPEVIRAYRAFADETRQQYDYLKNLGVNFQFVDNPAPYPNSAEMMKDIAENNRLLVYKTPENDFHPLLSPEENDMFRAVHDYFGHAAYGHQFGALGEENAFRVHSATFSPEARRAMATETRGQNSWVNTRPENKEVPGSVYAEQKVTLMPEEFMGLYPSEVELSQPTSGVTNVEYKSAAQKGFTPKEFKNLTDVERRLGRAAFIRRVVEPIVKSEGLPVDVAKGIGSWLSEGDPGLTEAARLAFQNMSGAGVARTLARVSQAAKQLGFFFPAPNPEGKSVALTLDFGKKLSESQYKKAISALTAADKGRRFNGTTMVALDPSRVQIVLNDGLDEQAAEELAQMAQKTLPRYNIQANTHRVTPIYGGGDSLAEAFRDYALRVGVLTPEQAKAQDDAIRAYQSLAESSRIGRAAAGTADTFRNLLDRYRGGSNAGMGGYSTSEQRATTDRLAGGRSSAKMGPRRATVNIVGKNQGISQDVTRRTPLFRRVKKQK